jgi:1,4-alpha-glucan branching enzyme
LIRREPTKRGDMVKVTFELPADAGDVFVVGDFNSWCVGETPLKLRAGSDVRSASLTLAAGRRYAFRYYVDGHWFNEVDADDEVPNPHSGTDSVIDLGCAG